MIEATLTLAALIPLAGYAGWRVGRSWSDAELVRACAEDWIKGYRKACENMKQRQAEHPNADDYRNRAERAEAALAEALAELAKYKLRRNAKGRFVRREP